MSWNLVTLDEVKPTPWRNGGGVTRELLAWPQSGEWKLRISIADVTADGPFSAFPGIERWFAVLEGEGVALAIGGGTQRLTPRSPPLCFDGGLQADCRLLGGATRDFNLMAAPGRARLSQVRGHAATHVRAPFLIAAYADRARLAARFGSEDPVDVAPRTLAWRVVEQPAAFAVESQDALMMEVSL